MTNKSKNGVCSGSLRSVCSLAQLVGTRSRRRESWEMNEDIGRRRNLLLEEVREMVLPSQPAEWMCSR